MNVFTPLQMHDAIKYIGKLGYDGVEFWEQYLNEVNLNELRDVLAESGLNVAQLCPYFDFTASNEQYEKSLKNVEKHVEYAKILDVKLIRVFTGKIGSSEAAPQIWRQGVKGLKQMCSKGVDKNIVFALETHSGSLMDTSTSTLRLLDEVGYSNLRVNLQVPLGNEDPYQTAETLGKHVVHIHAHNWIGQADGGHWQKLTYLDKGCLNFEKFLGVLHKQGFNGYISIEHADHLGSSVPFEVAEHEIKYLNSLIQKYYRAL